MRSVVLGTVVVSLVAGALLVGCGGNVGTTGSPPGMVAPQAVGATLTDAGSCVSGTVDYGSTNWYRVAARTAAATWVVTLSPTADADSDLRVFQLNADKGDLVQLGKSTRTPSQTASDAVTGGYAPDWVVVTAVANLPLEVGVYGAMGGVTTKPFRVEADVARPITLNVATATTTLSQYNSHWYRFQPTVSGGYTVHLTATSGDPDIYVYGSSSAAYLGKATGPGGGAAAFSGTAGAPNYMRVYGNASISGYNLSITKP